MFIPTTTLYTALLAFMFIALSINVIRGRRQFRVLLGDNAEYEMQRRIRAQGNFMEYTLFFLLMLGMAESNGLPGYVIHVLGLGFIMGRISHAYGLLKAEQNTASGAKGLKYRIRGMQCTFTILAILAVTLLGQYTMALASFLSAR